MSSLSRPTNVFREPISCSPPIKSSHKVAAEKLEQHNNWTFYGSGSTGAKAQQLFDKEAMISQAGFTLFPRAVLRTGWFCDFLERSGVNSALARGASSEEILGLIKEGEFNPGEQKTLLSISERFIGAPVAIRSSAPGDSAGTGVYASAFCLNNRTPEENLGGITEAVKTVLASYYSESAAAFRRDTASGDEGIAVMIENVFGESGIHEDRKYTKSADAGRPYFSPLLSGCGYSSTSGASGYVVLVAGLPTGAVAGEEDLLRLPLEEDNLGLPLSLYDGYEEYWHSHSEPLRCSACIWLDNGELGSWRRVSEDEELSIAKQKLEGLGSRLRKLEALAGGPQYFEWAMKVVDGKEIHTILQISDAGKAPAGVEFPQNPQNVLAESKIVGGEKRVVASGIFVCPSADFTFGRGAEMLAEYNEQNNGYLLVIDSSYFSSVRHSLPYSCFSNAAAVLLVAGWEHPTENYAAEHLRGLLMEVGKPFLSVSIRSRQIGRKSRVSKELIEGLGILGPPGLLIGSMDVKVEIIASETQQRGLVMLV